MCFTLEKKKHSKEQCCNKGNERSRCKMFSESVFGYTTTFYIIFFFQTEKKQQKNQYSISRKAMSENTHSIFGENTPRKSNNLIRNSP